MSDASREQRPPPGLLSAGELSARRAAWRRQRARRQAGLLAALVAGVLTLAGAWLLLTGDSAGHVHANSQPRLAAGGQAPAPSRPLPAPRRPTGGNARAVERVLGYTSYVQLAGRHRRDVALTFDDGPSQYTPQILRVLRRMHAVATFFVIGRWARAYPRLVAAEVAARCEVGDHTEDHKPLALLFTSAQTAELTDAAQAIHQAGAPYPLLMRPPYGSFNTATLDVLRTLRMLMVLWSADTSDYLHPGVAKIIYTAVSGARPGAIILMHDGGGDRSQTAAALPRIITRLRQRGFRLVTISQLLKDDPPPTNQPPPHPLAGRF